MGDCVPFFLCTKDSCSFAVITRASESANIYRLDIHTNTLFFSWAHTVSLMQKGGGWYFHLLWKTDWNRHPQIKDTEEHHLSIIMDSPGNLWPTGCQLCLIDPWRVQTLHILWIDIDHIVFYFKSLEIWFLDCHRKLSAIWEGPCIIHTKGRASAQHYIYTVVYGFLFLFTQDSWTFAVPIRTSDMVHTCRLDSHTYALHGMLVQPISLYQRVLICLSSMKS